jgi:hypothetical protein
VDLVCAGQPCAQTATPVVQLLAAELLVAELLVAELLVAELLVAARPLLSTGPRGDLDWVGR